MTIDYFSRRGFLQSSALAAVASSVLTGAASALGAPMTALALESDGLKGRLWKTLKIGMVQVPGTLMEKFKAVKDAGFDGIEMNAPGMNVDETKQAIAESGLPVDGTVNATHWEIRHTDPDATVSTTFGQHGTCTRHDGSGAATPSGRRAIASRPRRGASRARGRRGRRAAAAPRAGRRSRGPRSR